MESDRLNDLEIKYSHLELAVEKLHRTVFDQDVTIQKLEQLIRVMKDRLEGIARGDGIVGPPGEKPPHY